MTTHIFSYYSTIITIHVQYFLMDNTDDYDYYASQLSHTDPAVFAAVVGVPPKTSSRIDKD